MRQEQATAGTRIGRTSPASGEERRRKAPFRFPRRGLTDRNREIVRQVYEIAGRGAAAEHDQYMTEHGQYMSDGYSLTQAPGHPVPGHWTGAEADAAIARVFQACGNTGITVREIVADGAHRVIGLVDAHGTAHDGTPWTMPVAECFWIEDGRVTEIRPFYWDLVELGRIAGLA